MTACGLKLLEQAANYKVKLLVLDPVAGAFGGNENNRSQVRRFLSILGSWAANAKGGVLIIAHPAKGVGSTYSGSTDWEGGVQSRLHIARLDCAACRVPGSAETAGLSEYQVEQLRELRVEKANEAGSYGQKIGFTWNNDAGTMVECQPCPHDEYKRKGKSKGRGRGAGRAAQGQTATIVQDDGNDFDDAV